MTSWLPHRKEATVRYRSPRERSLWLLLAAVAAGALWAIAQQLDWPIAVRAVLAVVAAASVAVIPELRQRAARSDKSAQLVGRLGATAWRNGLPLASDTTLDDLRVHDSNVTVAYVQRDAEEQVDALLKAGTPTLLVGHSMAGKTRLAAERVKAVLPNAPLLIPPSTTVLRGLLDDGLVVKGVVVWLDDIDRFLKGESSMDVPLVQQLINGGGVLVGTVRSHEFQEFIPTDLGRPAPWDVLRFFTRIRLARRLTSQEQEIAGHVITEPAVLEAINRYGLAEYLGGGPQAVERYENGETENPVGHALVHAAIDWRRAGLTRHVPREDLVASLPEYLVDLPAISVDEASIERGFEWAVERINETVALLTSIERRNEIGAQEHLYEAFDYLVDQLAVAKVEIPGGVWLQVVKAASLAETGDVGRAADRFFYARPRVTAEIARWLNTDTGGKVLIVTGGPGVGKSYVLAHTTLMGANAERSSDRIQPAMPRFDLVTTAFRKNAIDLALELAVALDLPVHPDGRNSFVRTIHELAGAIRERGRPVFASIDGIDESTEPQSIMELLGALARIEGPSVHIIIAARNSINLPDWPTINLDDHRIESDSLNGFILERLLTGQYGNEFAADPKAAEQATATIAERSEGSILYAAMAADSWSPDAQENLESLRQVPVSIRDVLSERMQALAKDYPLIIPLLKVFARTEHRLSEVQLVSLMQDRADPEQVRDTLRALYRLSLITQTGKADPSGEVYFITHRLIRDYVREQFGA